MINEDIRHIIEAELLEGESLLWADKTSQKEIDIYIDLISTDTKFTKYVTILMILLLVGFFYMPEKFNVILQGILFYGLLYLFQLWLSSWKIKRLKNFNIGGYALSNWRLFELNKDLKIIDMFNAKSVKSVYEGSGGIVLKPIRSGWLKVYKLRFLERDIYLTINKLDALVKRSVL